MVCQVSIEARPLGGEQEGADGRAAVAIEAQGAVGLHHLAMRAHPGSVAAAAGEIPGAGEAVAVGDDGGACGVGRPPGDEGAGVGEDRLRHARLQERGDQGGTVGDEHVPRHRGIVAGDLLYGQHVGAGLHLVAAGRARQQHARHARVVQLGQKRRGDAPRVLDRVGGRGDGRAEDAGLRKRVWTVPGIHAPPLAETPLRPRREALSISQCWNRWPV